MLFGVVVGLFGLVFGSFLNVVIHRLPIMLERDWRRGCEELLSDDTAGDPGSSDAHEPPYNLVVPRSQCTNCGHPITALENIPLLSYIVLKGRCSKCKHRISIRYPLVELATGVLTGLAAWQFGFGFAAAGAVLLTCALITLSVIDFDHQLLPDNITLPFLWLGLLFNLFFVFTGLGAAVVGAIAGYLVLWAVYHAFRLLTGKEGMGYGDFKLTALLGAWLGWQALPGIILLSSLVGAVVGVTLIALKFHERSQPIPFGPYLASAGWIYLMWGPTLEQAYFGLLAG